jgi:hypothetical protein
VLSRSAANGVRAGSGLFVAFVASGPSAPAATNGAAAFDALRFPSRYTA